MKSDAAHYGRGLDAAQTAAFVVGERIGAVLEAPRDRCVQQGRHGPHQVIAEIAPDHVAAHRQRPAARFRCPSFAEVDDAVQPAIAVGELPLVDDQNGIRIAGRDVLDDALERDDLVLDIRTEQLQREERGHGSCITRQQIEAMRCAAHVAGVRLERGCWGMVALGRGGCPFRYIMNTARLLPGFTMDDVSPHGIDGIEVYMGAAGLPIEFQGLSSDVDGTCGVIVIWLRNRA